MPTKNVITAPYINDGDAERSDDEKPSDSLFMKTAKVEDPSPAPVDEDTAVAAGPDVDMDELTAKPAADEKPDEVTAKITSDDDVDPPADVLTARNLGSTGGSDEGATPADVMTAKNLGQAEETEE